MSFGDKSEFFAVLADLLPVHYFEKAPVVRIVWELWITIRTIVFNRSSSLTRSQGQAAAHQGGQGTMSSTESIQSQAVSNFLLTEITAEFNQRMVLLSHGYLKVSRDMSDYPVHKSIFDGTL